MQLSRFSDGRPRPREAGFALLLVMVFVGISLFVLGGALTWTSTNAQLTRRNNHYFNSVAAAEAATEKVLANVSRDFQADGEALVYANLASYRTMVPNSAESAVWQDWQFNNSQGVAGQNLVERLTAWGFVELKSQYTGLRGMAATYRVISNARHTQDTENITGAVEQEFQVANIPVFQFAIFYGIDMEISCGQPFNVTGRVHSNGQLYTCPDNALTFNTHVTSVGDIQFRRAPGDSRGAPSGTVTYRGEHDSKVSSLTLPIGTNNSPDAVRAIVQVPPVGENPNTPMGKQRYYNKADLILTINDAGISATSGRFNNFATTIPSSQVSYLASASSNFYDTREGKTVRPLDLDVGRLRTWSATNTVLRSVLGRDVRTVYVVDNRTTVNTSSSMGAVRVRNGATLPAQGLTVVTEKPMYVQGHYNAPNTSHRGTTNTTATLPASLVADAITVLSANWNDANSTASLSTRAASSTTVNAAFLAGIVETKTYNNYSGGVENFPRFLEEWGGSRIFTYNGSMVVMFPSRFATGRWGMSNVYAPPARNWAFDLNFMDATKLPPGTPEVRTLIRGQWAIVQRGPQT